MKRNLSVLFLFLSAVLCTTFAHAGTWSAPTPKRSGFKTNVACYLYNVQAQKFLSQGAFSTGSFRYGTECALSSQGLKFKIVSSGKDLYNLTDSALINGKWNWAMLFISAGTAYVDGGGRGSQDWTVLTSLEDPSLYEISINPTDASFGTVTYPNSVLGWDGTETNVVNPLLNIELDAQGMYGYKWAFVTESDYGVYAARVKLFNVLNAAETASVSTDAAATVYNNQDATADELTKAMNNLQQAINNNAFAKGSVDNPADASFIITNADFSDLPGKGWSEGTFKSGVCERYNTNFDVHQTLRGMKAGVYKVNVAGFYRDGNAIEAAQRRSDNEEELNAYVYAGNDSVLMQSIFTETDKMTTGYTTTLGTIPNVLNDAASWIAAGYYPTNEVYTFIDADTLNIGVKKHTAVSSDWTIMDNFSLFYYGNTAASYKLVLKPMLDRSATYTGGEVILGAQEATALTSELTKANATYNKSDATVDETKSAIVTLRSALGNCVQSAKNYALLKKAIADGQAANETYPYDVLSDYLLTAGNTYDEKNASADSVANVVRRIYVLIDYAQINMIKEGDDCTSHIVNPTFEKNNTTGWTYSSVDRKKPTSSNGVTEFVGGRFDINQTLTKIPNGAYTLTCQAFQRIYVDSTAVSRYLAGVNDILCCVYANDAQMPVMNIVAGAQTTQYASADNYDVGNGTYYPKSRAAAAAYFANGCYENKLTMVVTNNKMQLGIRYQDPSIVAVRHSWEVFDNFHLTYIGANVAAMKGETDKALQTATALQSLPMNADKKSQLSTAMTNVSSATDANAVALYIKLTTAIDSAEASASIYRTLSDAILEADSLKAKSMATAATMAAYNTTADAIKAKLDAGSYADTAIPSAIDELREAFVQCITTDANGSDANPVDVSDAIFNAGFDKGNAGWQGVGNVVLSEMQFYNSNNFNLSQTVKGLKNGTYKLSVSGYYSGGDLTALVKAHEAGNEALNAKLYANGNATPLMSILSHLDDTICHVQDVSVTVGGQTGYVCTSVVGARNRFDNGFYADNAVFANVTDHELTFGIRKDMALAKDWGVFDTFRLFYYGDHSTNGVQKNTVDGKTVVSRIYYNVSGIRSTQPMRGLNIVRTIFSDGSQSVNKIIRK